MTQGFQPTTPLMTPQQLMGMKSLMLQTQAQEMNLQEKRKQLDDESAMRDLANQPGMTDDVGFTPAGLKTLTDSGHGYAALNAQKQRAANETQKINYQQMVQNLSAANAKAANDKVTWVMGIQDRALEAADRVVDQGGSDEAAQKAGQEELTRIIEEEKKAGKPKEDIDRLNPQFNYQTVKNSLPDMQMKQKILSERVAMEEARDKATKAAYEASPAHLQRLADKERAEVEYKEARADRLRSADLFFKGGTAESEKAILTLGALKESGAPGWSGRPETVMPAVLGVMRLHPDWTPDEIAQNALAHKVSYAEMTAEGRKIGTILAPVNYAIADIDRLGPRALQTAKELDPKTLKLWNNVSQLTQEQKNDPTLRAFQEDMKSLETAYNMLVGRAGSSMREREKVAPMFATTNSIDSLERLINEMGVNGRLTREAIMETKAMAKGQIPDSSISTKEIEGTGGRKIKFYHPPGGGPNDWFTDIDSARNFRGARD